MTRLKTLTAALLVALSPLAALAQDPLRITITDGVIDPLEFAVPDFIDEGGAGGLATEIGRVVAADLQGHRPVRGNSGRGAYRLITSFDAPVSYPDWQAINAQALVTVSKSGGQIVVKFRSSTSIPTALGRWSAVRRALRAAGGAWRTRSPMPSIAASPAKARISTAAWFSWPKAARKRRGSSVWR